MIQVIRFDRWDHDPSIIEILAATFDQAVAEISGYQQKMSLSPKMPSKVLKSNNIKNKGGN